MKILITGAAGRLGQLLAKALHSKHELTLTDRNSPKNDFKSTFIKADLSDFDTIKNICQQQEIVLHFGASASKKTPWKDVLPNNVIGTYNVFEAAFQAKCQRVVFASSINSVYGYPAGMQIHADQPPNPHTLYGASKVWGESLARLYSEHQGMSVHCLRFGGILSEDEILTRTNIPNKRIPLDSIITHRDSISLIQACIDAPKEVQFGIFHGLSNNRWGRLDITETCQILNWQPKDDAFEIVEKRGNKNEISAEVFAPRITNP